MNIELSSEEARIIGCLMEKSVTTPDQYPLTLNALTNACNQKSSRDPVMNLNKGDVQRTCRELKDKRLVGLEDSFKNNTEKYEQRFCNTLLGERQFDGAAYALICLLLLRGPHTPGELRSRSGRLHEFADNQAVVDTLQVLMEAEGGAAVARLPRQAGRMDHEYAHLFFGHIESTSEDPVIVQRAPASSRDRQLDDLVARIDVLEDALKKLAEQLGKELDLER
ncbi:MAG: YceH family protein [Pseudomonadales bacterium]